MSVEMKDSGIAWLGKIPKHWNRISLKFLCQISTGDKDTVNKIDDGLYPFFVRSPQIERINSYTYDGEAILMAGDGVGAGRVFHYFCGKFDFHQRVYNLHNIQGAKGKFLYYYLSSNFYKLMDAGSAKSTVDSVRLPMLKDFPVVVPAIEEQSRIANFLDNKCAEIDELIALQEQMIAQLNAYKQAVITETVTKGFNPNVKMKDSGVEWIGEIPEHWEIKELKFALDGLCDGTHGTFERVNHGELLLSAKNIGDNDIIIDDNESQISFEDYKKIVANGFPKKGDVLLCCVGSIGKCCLYKEEKSIAFQRSVAFLRHNSTITSEYLMYLLKSNIMQAQYDMYARKSAQSGIYMGLIKDFIIITPNAQEQKNLADYLDQKCKEIDELISIKKEKIEQLKAYKKSVIYEYVTGKKETL